jgi:pimeloyl-ACP methyl ester carboxylesterase
VLAVAVAITVASLAYNFATRPRDTPRYGGAALTVDGTRLAYERWGVRGSPIVLLGGFAEPTWVWHAAAPLLARDHHVYAVDLPPFGFSQRRGPYTLAHWSELVRGFAARLHLRRPVVVGHSLGAAVAVAVAPATSGIVLLDGDALPGGGPGWLTNLLLPPWYTSAYRIATGSDWIFRRVLRNAWGKDPPRFDDTSLDAWQAPFRVPGTAAAFKAMLGHGIQGVSKETLQRVRVPRLVLWGSDDSVDSPSAGRATAHLLRTRFVSIPRAGHLSMLAAPAAVARAIDEFAARTRSSEMWTCGRSTSSPGSASRRARASSARRASCGS